MSLTLLPQKASSCFLASADVTSTPYTCTVGDVSLSLTGSNLTVSNSNVNVFSSNCPSALVALPANIKLVKDTNNVIVRFGNSNVLKAPANRFSPSFSNGSISFLGSAYTNPTYQPTQIFENPGIFAREISAPNLTLMNGVIESTSNALVSLSNLVVPRANFSSNTSTWSSNALFPKSGGNISGSVNISGTLSFTAPPGDPTPTISTRTVPAGQGGSQERTELILYHGHDPANGYGTDTITLRAPGLRFQTYNNTDVNDISNNLGANDRLYIDPVGRVGIGVDNPAKPLQVNGVVSSVGSEARYHLYNNGATAEWIFGQKSATAHNFVLSKVVSGTETDYVTVSPTGNVGINGTLTATAFAGGTITSLSSTGAFSSNTAVWSSNAVVSTTANLTTLSNVIVPQATFGSNAAVWGSNAVNGLTPQSTFSSNTSAWTSNSLVSNSNLLHPRATFSSNAAVWSSNNLFNKNTGGTVSGPITATGGRISTVANNDSRYHLYNNGSAAEWVFGQKDSSSHDFVLSKVVSGTESDYVTVDTSGNLEVTGDVTGAVVGATSYLTSPGGANGGGLFTALPSPVDGINMIPGDTSIGKGGITVINGSIADIPSGQTNSTLWVKGGVTASEFWRVGTFALGAMTMFFPFSVTVGTSGSQTKTQTGIQFLEGFVNRTMPTNNYHAIITYKQDGVSDVFVGKISDRTTTSLTLYTTRVNGSSWSQSVEAHIILWAK